MLNYDIGDIVPISVTFEEGELSGWAKLVLSVDWTVVVENASMTYVDGAYTYSYTIPIGGQKGKYDVLGVGDNWGSPINIYGTGFRVGDTMVVSLSEVKNSTVWFDFTQYTDAQLTEAIIVCSDILQDYLGYTLSDENETNTEKSQCVCDIQGRIVIPFLKKPIISVSSVNVRVPWTTKISLNVDHLEIYEKHGYAYYNTTSAFATEGTYPTIILTEYDTLTYEVVYVSWPNITGTLKYAVTLMCKNFMNMQYTFSETGVVGMWQKVSSFTSWKYTVKFGSSVNTPYTSWESYDYMDVIVTPEIRALINWYVRRWQNTF